MLQQRKILRTIVPEKGSAVRSHRQRLLVAFKTAICAQSLDEHHTKPTLNWDQFSFAFHYGNLLSLSEAGYWWRGGLVDHKDDL